jgi:cyclopropane fatty-acyl-phospholipid synthase-like methyltransferase
MKLDMIRKVWINSANKDINEKVKVWDSVSEDYKEKEIPKWQSNHFLKLLNSTVDLAKITSVLDVGCGAGTYTVALAQKVNKAVGVDLSPNMISFAKEKVKEYNLNNAEFICDDWEKLDINNENYEKNFDLVFAHMTPAIDSAATFEKLIKCSKKYCFFVKPVRRKDSVMDEVEKIIGLKSNNSIQDEKITYAFDMLWQLGYCPQFSYYNEIWKPEKTMEQAYAWYIGKVKTKKDISSLEEVKIKEYLQSIAIDGKIHEVITSTIVSIYWEV